MGDFKLYRRVLKDGDHIYGIEEVAEGENPLETGPCLLCWSAQTSDIKQNNGIVSNGLSFARICSSEDYSARVGIQDADIAVLTLQGTADYEEVSNALFENYIKPIIDKTNTKDELCKCFRNLNFLFNCNGASTANHLCERIYQALEKKGFSDEEIAEIMKNIVCLSMNTARQIDQKVTSFTIMDVEDSGGDSATQDMHRRTDESQMIDGACCYHDNNNGFLLVKRKDMHSPRLLAEYGEIMRAAVPILITQILENAKANSKSDSLIPLDIDQITKKVTQIMDEITNGKITSDEVLARLDEEVYEGIPRLNDDERKLLGILDEVTKNVDKIYQQFIITKKNNLAILEQKNKKVDSIIDYIINRKTLSDEQKEYLKNGGEIPKSVEIPDDEQNSVFAKLFNDAFPEGRPDEYTRKKVEEISAEAEKSVDALIKSLVLSERSQKLVKAIKGVLDRCGKDFENACAEYDALNDLINDKLKRAKAILPYEWIVEAAFYEFGSLGNYNIDSISDQPAPTEESEKRRLALRSLSRKILKEKEEGQVSQVSLKGVRDEAEEAKANLPKARRIVMKKISLSIAGMTCSACSNGLEKYLNKQDGIIEASVNLVMNLADVSYDEKKISLEDIDRFVKEAGFKSLGKYHFEAEEKTRKNEALKLNIVTLIAIISMAISMIYMCDLGGAKAFFELNPLIYVGSLFLLCTVAVILGFNIIKNGIINLIHKMPNMDSLITIRSFNKLHI